eukprot:scaffold48560_cov61-Phaeocystis_antarctica.AAC.5
MLAPPPRSGGKSLSAAPASEASATVSSGRRKGELPGELRACTTELPGELAVSPPCASTVSGEALAGPASAGLGRAERERSGKPPHPQSYAAWADACLRRAGPLNGLSGGDSRSSLVSRRLPGGEAARDRLRSGADEVLRSVIKGGTPPSRENSESAVADAARGLSVARAPSATGSNASSTK